MITETESLKNLNHAFSINGQLEFITGKGGMTLARITNNACTAEIYLHGGHITSYIPKGDKEVLWLAPNGAFKPNHPIRGGIPICWPWFGPHPEGKSTLMHGFARIEIWTVLSTREINDHTTEICLCLRDSERTNAIWPHKFELFLRITAGKTLFIDLTSRNTGNTPISITEALHTYFSIGDASRIRISGLDKCDYIDKADGDKAKTQIGDVAISSETVRIYVNTKADCIIDDPVIDRKVAVAKKNSDTTVVWNPWIEKSKIMPDLSDGDYQTMVCVETAKTNNDIAVIAPGKEHTMSTEISIIRQ